MTENKQAQDWYEQSYSHDGFQAQRRYPNEEFLRFLGRNYFPIPRRARAAVKVLDVGCGSGANLWMIASEGFDTYGVDLSAEGIALCQRMLDHWQVKADLRVGDMTSLPYADESFDVVADVFSSNCLTEAGYSRFLSEARRILNPGGKYFCYTPSKASDAFKDHAPAKLLDASTLDGVHRKTSPFHGNFYPWRFISPDEMKNALAQAGLQVEYLETTGRTYRNLQEYYEFVVVEAVKSDSE